MKRKLQVFVSSTFTDMLPERQAAVEAILRAGHIPAGMELFAAGDKSQWEVIRRWIDDSDVYMLMLGGRYGSIDSDSGKSYIQREYEYAIEKRKRYFALVIADEYLDAKVKDGGREVVEQDNNHLLKPFRREVTSKICRFYTSMDNLKLALLESLGDIDRDASLAGWIHGSEVIDPKAILEQVDRLQAENASLRARLADLEAITEDFPDEQYLADTLSDDAKVLLIAAAESDGTIMYLRYSGGVSVQVADRNLIDPMTPREEARWKSALRELRENGLVESTGSRGENFEVTKRGYDTVDEIKARAAEVSPPETEGH